MLIREEKETYVLESGYKNIWGINLYVQNLGDTSNKWAFSFEILFSFEVLEKKSHIN